MPTQAERTASTRARLLDAAVDVLAERGYAATTTVEVARRAGVSRGAQLHHFPTKAELLAAAVEHLHAKRRAEFRDAMASVPDSADRLDAGIDLLWSVCHGSTFTAWVELQVAARTDDELRPLVADLNRRALAEDLEIFHEVMPLPEPALERDAFTFAFSLMEGLSLHRLSPEDPEVDVDAVLNALKSLARLALPAIPEGAR